MKRLLTTLLFLITFFIVNAQTTTDYADSIRIKYKIPELAFAVVSADTIFEFRTLGVQRINTDFTARPDDRFHIGSNTKAITSFISALLEAEGQIKWDTKFLELFPEVKRNIKTLRCKTYLLSEENYQLTLTLLTSPQINKSQATTHNNGINLQNISWLKILCNTKMV